MTAHADSLVLLASAGTGKTYRLSLRFLRLLAQGEAPESLLASTFTRKAAGEILGAILGRLALACASEEASQELGRRMDLEEAWTRKRSIELLDELLTRLPRLNIRTLDSWFQTQVAIADLSLGLPLGWRLAEQVDQDRLDRQVAERTILGLDGHEVQSLLADVQRGKAKRSLLESGLEHLKDAAALHAAAAGAETPWQCLASIREPSVEELQAALAALDAVDIPLNSKGAPNKTWQKGMMALKQALLDGDWDRALKNGPLAKVFAGESAFSKHPLPMERFKPAAELVSRHQLALLHRDNLAHAHLAAAYATNRRELYRQASLIDYDDFPAALAACDEITRAHLLEQAGTTPRHLLLDEFQDTSVLQWQAIAPVAEAAVQDPSGSLFAVGDIKQSIYGFREGEPRLLASLAEWYHLPVETMAVNYRSRQPILDAVNHVFANLPQIYGAEADPVVAAAATAWQDYPPHQAADPEPGRVRLWQVHGERAGDIKAMRRATFARALAIARAHPAQRLGVLVRSNKDIAVLIAELTAAGIPATGAGGNALTDSHAVDVALSLFQLADHPGDTAAWFHVATSPLAPCFEFRFRPGDAMRQDADRASRRLRKRLQEDGASGLLEQVDRELKARAAYDPFNLRRFGQLIEAAIAWDARGESRASGFVDLVHSLKVAELGGGQVQVMTIHQSKGLAFDRVLLPIPYGNPRESGLFAVRPDPRQAPTVISRVPSTVQWQAAQYLGHHAFLDGFRARQVQLINDMMCVLYVAMTRARLEMELLLPPPAKEPSDKPGKLSTDQLLRDTILRVPSPEACDSAENDGLLELIWQAGQPLAPISAAPPEEAALTPALHLAPARGERHLARWTPSADSTQKLLGQRLLQTGDTQAMRRGSALHLLFAEVAFLPQRPEASVLSRALATMQPPPTAEEAAAWLREFEGMLVQQGIAKALSRPEGAEEVELWRERPFALRSKDAHGHDSLLQGIYDRVEILDRGLPTARARILDFKTGAPPADGLMPSSYAAQLAAYRHALAQQLALPPQAIRAALLYLDADLILEDGESVTPS